MEPVDVGKLQSKGTGSLIEALNKADDTLPIPVTDVNQSGVAATALDSESSAEATSAPGGDPPMIENQEGLEVKKLEEFQEILETGFGGTTVALYAT